MSAKTMLISTLNRFPALKRIIKDLYQFSGNFFSDKKSWPNSIVQVSSKDSEHLFGYYDKTPWDSLSESMIYLRVSGANKQFASENPADIVLRSKEGKEKAIASTRAWNVQQGCMLQWYAKRDDEILFNDFRDGSYCSVVKNIQTGEERKLAMPVYSVSEDGKTALTLDFSRLHTLRPGYGYCNLDDKTRRQTVPDGPAIYRLDLVSNSLHPLYTYAQLAALSPKPTMEGAYHKVNHIMISPSGKAFMFLHRWILNGRKYDRMLCAPSDGCSEPKILLDEDMVSHSNWKDENTIISYANALGKGAGYYLVDVPTGQITDLSSFFPKEDGHPSYSPDRRYVITDTYPSLKRKQSLFLVDMEKQEKRAIASVYANIRYRNETRCDLHPRWSPNGRKVCFDGSLTGRRQVYAIELEEEIK
ncbi:MAG: TolB family protein [Christensenellales bacterium]|jgi:hypothetical protein